MKIILAGFNLDYETIREVRAANPGAKHFTPETLSAAYARISRNPAPVNELRAAARKEVEKARRSNQVIVFDMGHSSIAEHAVFSIDVLGVSRLLVEEIEKFRLCSYTEKSQRYVLLQDDFVIPREIREAGLAESFTRTVKAQNAFYHRLYEGLLPWVLDQNRELAAVAANRSILEGWAKEDARYVLCLATETQLGMTLNTRNLELMLRRLAACPLDEAREYSRQLYNATRDIAPSLVRYTAATEYDCITRDDLREIAGTILGKAAFRPAEGPPEEVHLAWATPDADTRTAAALLHAASRLPLEECQGIAASMASDDRQVLFKASFRCMKAWDTPLREFENVDLQFDLVVSASCFAQLKRHRMATLVTQDYDPALDVTVPPSIAAIGMEKPFRDMMARTEETFETIRRTSPLAAPYILTNAHRKRVLMKMNAREFYHITRLRADRHAQWDIRQVTEKMLAQARKAMPLTLMMAGGKDQFAELYGENFPIDLIQDTTGMIQFNALFVGFIVLFAAAALTRHALSRMNIAHLREHGHIVPEAFREEIDGETLARMRDYTVESSRFQSLESLADDAILLAVLLGGALPWLCGVIESWGLHAIWSGTLFFGILYGVSVFLDIPFSLYSTFVIEKKYGFSTISPQLWLIDLAKSFAVSVILMALLFIPFFALIHTLPQSWWFAAWVFFALFQMLMIWLYPLVIAPLFNKYVPVRDETLRERILAMAEKAGLRAEGIFEVDAGKRSRHSNAYFTGLGKSKRIVLFDTLLATHSHDEIIAVLAHEIGHWKLRHVLKQLLAMEAVAFAGFYLVYRLMGWPMLYETFGFAGSLPYSGLLLAAILLKPLVFFLTPIGAAISRKYEKDADNYVLGLIGSTRFLAQALKRLAKENLANLHPHPAYVAFYYSHPPLAERVARLQAIDNAHRP